MGRGPMTAGDAFLDLVAHIYDAAVDSDAWAEVLPRIARAVDADGGLIGYITPARGRTAVQLSTAIGDETFHHLWQEFESFDPWYDRSGRLPMGTIALGQNVIPWEELRTTEVHRAILHPAGLDDILVNIVGNHQEGDDYVTLHRRRVRGPFTRREARVLEALSPHLIRAAQIHQRIGSLSQTESGRDALLDLLPYGVILLDDRGRPIYANSEAERILAAGDGLSVRAGHLRAAGAEAQRALERAVAAACAGRRSDSGAVGALMAVLRPSLARPYQVLVAPLRERQRHRIFSFAPGSIAAVAVVSDPEAAPEPAAETLARVFHLPPSLARLAAALAAGRTVTEHAENAGISVGTARGQLKELFGRTGTGRQAELVRLLLSSIAQLRLPDGE